MKAQHAGCGNQRIIALPGSAGAGARVVTSNEMLQRVFDGMEHFSRMYGVYVSRDCVVWNGLSVGDGQMLEYSQTWQVHSVQGGTIKLMPSAPFFN